MAVEVKTKPRFEHGTPKALFDSRIPNPTSILNNTWSPSPDGARFLFITRDEEEVAAPITVIVNWQAGLKQ